MDHDGSSDRRHPAEQRGLRLYHGVDFSLLGLKVTKVSWVAGVIHNIRIVVATSRITAQPQVTVLMDVHSPGLWIAICGEATEPNKDSEFSLRVFLLEQHMAVHFGQTICQRGAGSHFTGCIQSGIVLRDLWRNHSVTLSRNTLLTGSQHSQ